MNELSKQQLILLALLVSFMTSLATGIVTVSLMDQAPSGVQQTITQVIQKTIQQVVPQDAAVIMATSSQSDQIADSVKNVSNSLVKFKDKNGGTGAGLGIMVSTTGVIISNKPSVAGLSDYIAVLPNGAEVPVAIIQSQIEGDIIFLAPISISRSSGAVFTPITIGAPPVLGQTILALSGTSTAVLSQGIVTNVSGAPSISIGTSISPLRLVPGSPLFDISGTVLGIRTSNASDDSGASFYSLKQLQSVIPVAR